MDNTSLIDDRITRGKGVIMKAMGICDEVALGQYHGSQESGKPGNIL